MKNGSLENFTTTTDPTTMTASTATNSTSNPMSCNPIVHYSILSSVLIPVLQVIVNALVSIATIRSRATLRNNFVYAYVVSTLWANVIFGILAIYTIVNRVLAFETTTPSHIMTSTKEDNYMSKWWGFRVAFVINLYLVMSANISSLIYGIRESSFFVGPGLTSKPDKRKGRRDRTIKQKRNRAIVVICLSWSLPIFFTMLEVAGWNCLDYCKCFDANYEQWQELCRAPDNRYHCSKSTPPLTNFYLMTVVILWVVLCAVLGITMFTTIQKYRSSLKRNTECSSPRPSVADYSTNGVDNEIDFNLSVNQNNKMSTVQVVQPRTENIQSMRWSNLNYTLRLMFLLSGLFVIFSSPTIIIMILDMIFETSPLTLEIISFAYVANMLYCIMVPIILVHYMPRLRTAVVALLSVCVCCTKTVILRGQPTVKRPTSIFRP